MEHRQATGRHACSNHIPTGTYRCLPERARSAPPPMTCSRSSKHFSAISNRIWRPLCKPCSPFAALWAKQSSRSAWDGGFSKRAPGMTEARGFCSFAGYNPKERTGVVVLSNAFAVPGIVDIGMHLLHPKLPVINLDHPAHRIPRGGFSLLPGLYGAVSIAGPHSRNQEQRRPPLRAGH